MVTSTWYEQHLGCSCSILAGTGTPGVELFLAGLVALRAGWSSREPSNGGLAVRPKNAIHRLSPFVEPQC
jgi:hypothetical protein